MLPGLIKSCGRGVDPCITMHESNTPHPRKRPLLTPTRVPAGGTPDPTDAAFVSTRTTTLTHELATLLDGSMRTINIARQSLERGAMQQPTPEQIAEQVDCALRSMQQVSSILRASTTLSARFDGVKNVRWAYGSAGALAGSIHHAVDVTRQLAAESRATVHTYVDEQLWSVAAGPVFSVVVQAIRNAVEASRRNGYTSLNIHIMARLESSRPVPRVLLEIADDSGGLPRNHTLASFFDFGVTSKTHTPDPPPGLGLALVRELVHSMGGDVELIPQPPTAQSPRPGTILRTRYACPFVPGACSGGA